MTPGAGRRGGDTLAQAFEAQRPRLVRVAYATAGSVAEAEDCVQEAWLRLRRVEDPAGIRDLGAWLTTTVSGLALDALGRAQAPGALRRSLAARTADRGHRRPRSGRPGHAR
jgi:RNA polymerase sigma-70 factor (ECF subfamily)